MKKAAYYIAVLVICILAAVTACRKAYAPKLVTQKTGYLVVEGIVNSGPNLTDSTIFHLSRTVALSAKNVSNPELGALVTIHGGNIGAEGYTLYEAGNGYYKLTGGLQLDPNGHYYVTITTSDSRVYKTDSLAIKNAPPIDSVSWKWDNNGISVYVNAHDPANKTTFYRWSTVETYVIRSALQSDYMLITTPKDTIVPRPLSQEINQCWVTDTSTTIVLGSSAKLSQDVISHALVTSVPNQSEKIFNRYSVLVKQYALTDAAFNYWQQLKKNSEQLGGVFDPQPSELPGNIHCISNPTEKVLGYISVGKPSEARIFIDNAQLFGWVSFNPAVLDNCAAEPLYFHKMIAPDQYTNQVQDEIYTGQLFVLEPIVAPGGVISGYTASSRECQDCTLRGTNVKPVFWVDRH